MNLLHYFEKNYKIVYLFAMLSTALWIAYIKGWILAPFQSISAEEALKLIKQKHYPIVDIREAKAYKKGHIRGAISLPFSKLENGVKSLETYKKSKILIYSTTGRKGIDASRYLAKKGFKPINIKSGVLGLAIVGKNEPTLFEK